MDHDSTDHPKTPRKARRGAQPDQPPEALTSTDVDPATSSAEEDDEARLPEAPEDVAEDASEDVSGTLAEGTLAIGHAAIENAVRLAPTSSVPSATGSAVSSAASGRRASSSSSAADVAGSMSAEVRSCGGKSGREPCRALCGAFGWSVES